jgi:hypothetical protein
MCISFADRMWRMGGFAKEEDQFHPLREIWSSPDGHNWTLATATPAWSARGGGALVVHDGKLWLLGGAQHPRNGTDQTTFGDVWSSEDGVDWIEVCPKAPWKPRAFHSAIAHDGQLWVMGGGHWDKRPTLYRDVWSSSDGIHWEQRSEAAAWRGRIWATAASCDGLLWMMGGFSDSPRGGTSEVWCSVDGSDWYRYLPAKDWPARMAHSSIVFSDRLWVLAGSNGDYFNDIWALNVASSNLLSDAAVRRTFRWLYQTIWPR